MLIVLAYVLLHIICTSSLYAAAFPVSLNWGKKLQDKLIMPCRQMETTPGIAHGIIYFPSSFGLIVSSKSGSSNRVYHINTLERTVIVSPELHIPSHISEKPAIESDVNIAIVATTAARVCIAFESGNPLISVRTKNSDNVIKLSSAVPLANMLAIYAFNIITKKKHIGLCSIDNRTIHTFSPTCSAEVDITSLALSDDGSKVAWGTDNGSLYIRSTETDAKERLLRTFFNKRGRFLTLAWSPDKSTLACSITPTREHGHYLFLITTGSGRILHEQKMSSPITACTFIDHTTLAFCTTDKTHIHKLHLHLPGILALGSTLADLIPSARKLCMKTADCAEPYTLLPSEQETYKKLPEILRHAWLFKST